MGSPSEAGFSTTPPQTSIEEIAPSQVVQPTVSMAPTRSSFLATWKPVTGATGYHIDISTSRAFDSYVAGYNDLDVGNVTNRIVSRLRPGTSYYYRITSYNSLGLSHESEVMTSTTGTGVGLVINPTFDSSITNNPNAAAIESMINQVIAIYQSLFSDPITVEILFRYATTQPDGSRFGTNQVAQSNYVVYDIPWSTYIGSLTSDAKTSNDASANANLPTLEITPNITPSGADGRALGLVTPPAMFGNGHVGSGGPYDGIVSLNSTEPLQFTRPPGSAEYDAQTATEHEIDEVLGLGSFLHSGSSDMNLRPQDLFSWSGPGTRSRLDVGVRYFSIDDGITDIVNFNQTSGFDYGDWLSEPCPQSHPYVQNAAGCEGQFSDVTATSPEGVNLDVIGYDLTPLTVLGNISTRGLVETGDEVLIGGFIITGTQPKEVIVRAIGPSLPVSGTLADPFLELHDASNAVIASNDNWRSNQEAAIIATGLAPTNDNESAIVMTLQPGAYTAIVRGATNGTGVALVEVYDLNQSGDSKLANISTRGFVGTGDNVLIGGFIVLGNDSAKAILRAIGPSLTQDGVANALQDPTLELHDGNGTTIASNDDWMDSPDMQTIIDDGLAPTAGKESAILTTLPPGPYTAIVSGVNDTTGVGLVEVYQLAN